VEHCRSGGTRRKPEEACQAQATAGDSKGGKGSGGAAATGGRENDDQAGERTAPRPAQKGGGEEETGRIATGPRGAWPTVNGRKGRVSHKTSRTKERSLTTQTFKARRATQEIGSSSGEVDRKPQGDTPGSQGPRNKDSEGGGRRAMGRKDATGTRREEKRKERKEEEAENGEGAPRVGTPGKRAGAGRQPAGAGGKGAAGPRAERVGRRGSSRQPKGPAAGRARGEGSSSEGRGGGTGEGGEEAAKKSEEATTGKADRKKRGGVWCGEGNRGGGVNWDRRDNRSREPRSRGGRDGRKRKKIRERR